MSTLVTERPLDSLGPDGRPTTLKPVLDVISPERYENPTWKGLAYFARDMVLYGLLVAGLILVNVWWAVALLWVLSAFVVSGLFILGHDAAHGALFKSKKLNSIIGHVAMLPSWHVYEGWVLGHNRIHHGHTCRESMDFVWHPLTPEGYDELSWIHKARHRVEWSWVGSMPYYIRDVWWNKMIAFDPPAKWASKIRRDRLIIFAFIGLSSLALGALGLAMYGSAVGALWMIVKVLVVPFIAFSWMIGWVVHMHHIDRDIRWHKRREWNKFRGQMEGTTVMRVPGWMDFFLHRIFFHVAHHVDMRIPFYELPAACDEIEAGFPDVVISRKLRIADFTANTRQCKLYDFDAGQWLTYEEGREALSGGSGAASWGGTNSF